MPAASQSFLFAALHALGSVGNAPASTGPSIVGLDHIPTVVADLEQAGRSYTRLGFSLKPGRAHDDGLRNQHLKFSDGSGIELISVPDAPSSEITRSYSALLRQGEGPAYLALHARDTEALGAALEAAGLRFENTHGLVKLADPQLDYLFLVRDNRSPTDRPEHFAHANGALAMSEVWLALDAPALRSLRKLLLALGAVERIESADVPTKATAHVFYVQNGRVVVVPKDRQLIEDREIIGVRFTAPGRGHGNECAGDDRVNPGTAHGLWLCFANDQVPLKD